MKVSRSRRAFSLTPQHWLLCLFWCCVLGVVFGQGQGWGLVVHGYALRAMPQQTAGQQQRHAAQTGPFLFLFESRTTVNDLFVLVLGALALESCGLLSL